MHKSSIMQPKRFEYIPFRILRPREGEHSDVLEVCHSGVVQVGDLSGTEAAIGKLIQSYKFPVNCVVELEFSASFAYYTFWMDNKTFTTNDPVYMPKR